MMRIRLAKPVMENEEGMNHLWIQVNEYIADGRIQIQLPYGIYRKKNLNEYPENESGIIELDKACSGCDVLIEIYTEELVSFEACDIIVVLESRDQNNTQRRIIHSLPLTLVSEDRMNEVIMDEDVAARVKQLHNPFNDGTEKDLRNDWYVVIPPLTAAQLNDLSELEKKYRVDY